MQSELNRGPVDLPDLDHIRDVLLGTSKVRLGSNLAARFQSRERPESAQSGRDLGHADLAGVAPEAAADHPRIRRDCHV